MSVLGLQSRIQKTFAHLASKRDMGQALAAMGAYFSKGIEETDLPQMLLSPVFDLQGQWGGDQVLANYGALVFEAYRKEDQLLRKDGKLTEDGESYKPKEYGGAILSSRASSACGSTVVSRGPSPQLSAAQSGYPHSWSSSVGSNLTVNCPLPPSIRLRSGSFRTENDRLAPNHPSFPNPQPMLSPYPASSNLVPTHFSMALSGEVSQAGVPPPTFPTSYIGVAPEFGNSDR